MPSSRALVWFKRDLRMQDHAPLVAALAHTDVAAVFVVEPVWLQSPECDVRHVDFALTCLTELRADLAARGLPLMVRVGEMVSVLAQLHQEQHFTHLLSHEETGPGWSYTRDRQVASWCKANQVFWQEWPQTGVIRGLGSRTGWASRWQSRMDSLLQSLGSARYESTTSLDQPQLPSLSALGLPAPANAQVAAGERAAHQTLASFLSERALGYRQALSSPLTAQDTCSRLSAHLAFGTISMRTVHQATEAAKRQAADRAMAYALTGFAGRLRWHCHFMQKLESEPAIEFQNFARACDGLREDEFNDAHFEAWRLGRTGYPMVDACMRSLVATGWLNFRMRAMLVSFASYHLWLHWRQTGLFLARQFLDFEPGIHWSQMQMQSGTTGINTLRIYSPVKQARDQDPQGIFIRQWVPELARVPLPYLAEPWKMDISVQRMAGCLIGHDYPAPLVDDKIAMQAAKARLYGLRAQADARAEAQAVQQRHGSRKSGLPPSGQKRSAPRSPPDKTALTQQPPGQGQLFS